MSSAWRRSALGLAVFGLLLSLLVLVPTARAAGPCDVPVLNPIACENSKPGNSPSEWDVNGAGSSAIQGFATDISVDQGGTVGFKVDTTATRFRVDIYRLGYYAGSGARLVASIPDTQTTATNQPNCSNQSSTGLVDCGNWSLSATWTAPADAVSGVYIAKLVGTVGLNGSSHAPFIVRDDDGGSPVLFQTSDTTWQAYNSYGGNSLYVGSPAGRAYKVSYNRPFTTRGTTPEDFLFNAEYPTIRFLEANGYNVSYSTGVDSERRGDLIKQHEIFMSVGHDEYWSGTQRTKVEEARDAGVHLAFMSGNEVFWKTRWENSNDGTNTPHRTLVSYKETHANAKIDPIGSSVWTGTWRDPRFSPPADGGRPENALTGQIFTVNCCTTDMTVDASHRDLRFWRNTRVASLAAGQETTLGSGILGYEWDEDLDNGARPAGLVRMSETIESGDVIQDYGNNYDDGTATHHLSLYRAPSGALVFGAGTVQWGWGLDDNHDEGGSTTSDAAVRQATVNLFADMSVQPSTLQSGLVNATASTDTTAPASTISSPVSGATVQLGSTVTISGTATDAGGGTVGAVEVSTDNGQNWHPASGRGAWTYNWQPTQSGNATIKTRAADDGGRLETPNTGITVIVGSGGGGSGTCPCTIWPDTAPQTTASSDTAAVELGVKFRASEDGRIAGVRFYKPTSANGGTHLGRLWSASGTKLADATFSGESATGWQQVSFASPVNVTAGATYVASYYAPQGRYAANNGYFSTAMTRGPLTALANGTDGGNGVYRYGAGGGFPSSTYSSSNYWVDVVFEPANDTFKPTVSAQTPAPGSTGVATSTAVNATFSEPVQQATVAMSLTAQGGGTVNGSTAYDAATRIVAFTPSTALAPSTTYTVSLSGAKDTAGNTMDPVSWTFTTQVPDTTKPTLTSRTPAPNAIDVALTTDVLATFGEAVQQATIVVGLTGPGGTPVPGSSSYDAASRVLTFTPSTPLTGSTQYTASVSGAKDTAGNTMEPVTWTFTTQAGDTQKPTVTSRAPAAGGTGVATTVMVTATFDEAIQPGTTVFAVSPSGGSAVAGTTTYDAASRTATFTPAAALSATTLYSVSLTGARDTAGNTMDPVTWSFTTGAASVCPCTIWPSTATPSVAAQADTSAVELGVKFRTGQSGLITGIRFYKGAGNTGTHVGSLWSSGGSRLANVTFTGESATGWQQATFSAPVTVAANTTYIASYYAPLGRYSINDNYFSTATTRGPLTALANGTDGGNGVYRYGSGGGFPTGTYQSSNYWVDVVFQADTDTTKPTVTSQSPAPGSTGVGLGSPVSATFSEAVQPTTIVVGVTAASGGAVAGTTAYDAATRSVSFTPTAALAPSTTYTVALSGAKDLAGNTMDPVSWNFTTQSADTTKPTVTDRSPIAGATGVALGSQITVTFSEPVQPSTIGITVTPSGGSAVAGSIAYDAATRVAAFTPTAGLSGTTSYTVSVSGTKDLAGNTMDAVTWSFTTGSASLCPCTVFAPTAAPATAASTDSSAVELGVKFRTNQPGYITGIRFYKGAGNTGTHVGSLWSSTGTRLATVTFTGESATGWQQATFSAPVSVTAGTTYIASYHAPVGRYSLNSNYFSADVVRGPLTAPSSATSSGNGVYRYGASGFPASTFNASNYWVDVVFATSTADTTAPTVVGTSPAAGQSGVTIGSTVSANFSEPVSAATIQAGLTGPGGTAVPITSSYDAGSYTVTLTPSAPLAYSSTYSAQITGATDPAGNTMAPVSWSFTTAAEPPPGPPQGPGGPVGVVTSGANPYSTYLAEILRAEGINEFGTVDLSAVNAAKLATYDTVVLGQVTLTQTHVDMFTAWVQGGGNLIAMRPDPKLASLLGLTAATGSVAEGYLSVNTAVEPGAGVSDQTIQFHGTADRYSLSGATSVATLYTSATTATANPAVTLRSVGSNGGQAGAFTYDLARSVVQTRQGNPAWAGQERDGDGDGVIRTDDMFVPSGSAPGWVDMDKVGIPQADEQQRLLANMILSVNRDKKPLPRFWYFPGDAKAVVVATGDDHASGGTAGRMAIYQGNSTPGCSVVNWQCLRFTSFVYPDTSVPGAKSLQDNGFEIGLHPENGCDNFTPAELADVYTEQLGTWRDAFPTLRAPESNRFHCLVWSDWGSQFETELANGIRLDTNYYYWPGSWVDDRPGFMTGSGMPMRFAKQDGTMVDVYQAATQMTDESDQSYPFTPDTLFDRALGSLGYYGFFTANMHSDDEETTEDEELIASAQQRGVPVVTAKQLLDWLDGRNTSSFANLAWSGNSLTFSVSVGTGATNLRAMLPTSGPGGSVLSTLSRGGSAVTFTEQTIKGVEYAVFNAAAGGYAATYAASGGAPNIAQANAFMETDGTATVQWETNEPATSEVLLGTEPDALTRQILEAESAGEHAVALDDLEPGGSYYFRVASTDPTGARTVWPAPSVPPATLVVPAKDATAPVISDLAVSTLPDGTAEVTWKTNEASDSTVSFGEGASLDESTYSGDLVKEHEVVVRGLESTTPYSIQAMSKDATGNSSAPSQVATVTTSRAGVADQTEAAFNAGDATGAVTVDEVGSGVLTVEPRARAQGIFTSRVLDARAMVEWDRGVWEADVPQGAKVRVRVRTGSTPTPDATWSAWKTLSGPDETIGASSRYLQYELRLTAPDGAHRPVVEAVGFTHKTDVLHDDHEHHEASE